MRHLTKLDSLVMVVIDALYQGDETRLDKVFSQLNSLEQEILKALVDCWRTDTISNSSPLNKLISVSQGSQCIIASLFIAEKSLDIGSSKLHTDSIFRAFSFIDKTSSSLDKHLLSFYYIVKTKGFIFNNDLDKALSLLNSLDTEFSKFIEGYKLHLLGLLYKLKSNRFLLKAENHLRNAINIFELHHPNIYLLNLSKLHLAFFLHTSPSELLQIANEFKKLGCARELNLTLAQHNHLTKLNKDAVITNDISNSYTSVGNYYFIGEAMKDSLRRLTTIASGNGNVLILGDEGTGKEVFARTIHKISARSTNPFISFNCAQLKNELFESEFFGYEKGAFTGADKSKKGLLEEANGGILFLDEIAELTPQVQSKLLTVLQDGSFRRLGSNKEIKVDIRFIGATNKELSLMVERDNSNRQIYSSNLQGTFRSDLLNRFLWKIMVPCLDKRKDEILLLADLFLAELSPNETFILDNNAKEYLLTKKYPSNIRSLKSFLECAITCARQNKALLITAKLLLEAETFMQIEKKHLTPEHLSLTFHQQVKLFETNLLRKTLIESNHNVTIAASKLGLPKTTFYDYLKRHNLQV